MFIQLNKFFGFTTCVYLAMRELFLITYGLQTLLVYIFSNYFLLFKGHEYAVRRIQFSPHRNSVIASVSYDFTTRYVYFNFFIVL